MSELPRFISDLALILMIAGLVTLIFKRLKQPLVLGYIVAGFICGPHITFTPTVADMASVDTWADIGVIFLMFTLGLEFSFKKIVKMGMSPIVAACLVIALMMCVGNAVGYMFGWSHMDRMFLGGMLAMSSTTIIYKAFGDLGLREQKFTGEVLSVLVLEDILGILLMVVLSAMAVSRNFEGEELVYSFLKLAFVLVLWFIIGIYLVPQLLEKNKKWINRETLLIVSVGLCFALVVLACRMGYSPAFGAFMMGSILSETVEAEDIERLISPVRDLFGAIFFVSVGMLVDPGVLLHHWPAVLAITAAIILGQAVFGTAGFLASGQSLKVSMQCGFSLAQIGEFAFIIAALGQSLHVTSGFLYPVVVAVSIITTFLTPYMIRAAVPAYSGLLRMMPSRMRDYLSPERQRRPRHKSGFAQNQVWSNLNRALLMQTGAYIILTTAVVAISLGMVLPLSRALAGHWVGNAISGLTALVLSSPFLRAIVMRKNHSEEYREIWQRGRKNRFLLRLLVWARFVVAVLPIYYVLNFLSPFWWPFHVVASVLIMLLMIKLRVVKYASIRLERTFMQNLRSREIMEQSSPDSPPSYAGRLLSRDLHMARLDVPARSSWGGKTLAELQFGRNDGVLVASIIRDGEHINIPDGNQRIFPGDSLDLIGDDAILQSFSHKMQNAVLASVQPASEGATALRRMTVGRDSELLGKTMAESQIRPMYGCLVVGFENESGSIDIPSPSRTIMPADIVWAVGTYASLDKLEVALKPLPAEEL